MNTVDSYVKMDTDTDDDGYYDDDYYNYEDTAVEVEPVIDPRKSDPEYFEFKCFTREDVEIFLNEYVETICASLSLKPSIAKILLHVNNWATSKILASYKEDASKLLIDSKIKPEQSSEMESQAVQNSRTLSCSICLLSSSSKKFCTLACGHYFCKNCWCTHFEMQVFQGISTHIECMGQGCSILVPEDLALSIIKKSSLKEKYRVFSFSDYIKSHPQLRFCPGPSCDLIIFAEECQSKCVVCKQCKTSFCFKCGADYHAPTKCDIIKQWLIKCEDDSETANYISANTKDCPKCVACIEKSGGCNHMRCTECKHEFCWMCLGDWKIHIGEHYQCSKYKGNPDAPNKTAQAREALKKYLFYYERWDNHAKSLKLEENTLQKIKEGIDKKVMANEGTWIDWQYLKDAADLLLKCRYTLQYTYPFAYYMESGPRKQLFEYQQAQLEAEIENLSWKLEPTEVTARGDLENQMDVAEKRRTILLKDFLAA